MDPIFIYNNSLTFDENQRFILNFIEVSNDITQLKQYDDIEKKSIIANRYIRNGIDYGFDPPEIEIIFDNKTYLFEINKISHNKAVDVYNFYDHLLKRKRFAIVYSLYKDFVENGVTYEKKNKSDDIGGYTIKIIKNNKDFIQKEIYFNESRLVLKIKKTAIKISFLIIATKYIRLN